MADQPATPAPSAPDYRNTVFLPATDFPMKAGLPQLEAKLLARWEEMDLYKLLRATAKGREKFVLHDGPPYANGHLHIGHALNKILKDVIVRARQMTGYDSNYVPGWDCHGLPIEWKIEEEYRAKGKNKDDVPVVEFRRQCREFAEKWIAVQREEFKRLGVVGDWKNPYMTMAFPAEGAIVRELGKFVMNGALYRGAKPVLWSVVEKTALADAEVEYEDHTSTTVWVKFPVVETKVAAAKGASIVIWTTTPWTMPGNRLIAFGDAVAYDVVEVKAVAEGALAKVGEKIVVAHELLETTLKSAKITEHAVIGSVKGEAFTGTVCRHPFAGQGYDFPVPMYAGDFVTTEAGTGFVHGAPGHGEDDWILGMKHNVPVPDTVDGEGKYMAHVPLFAGKHVFKIDADMIAALTAAGALLAHGKLTHSYPHSWRSKAPLIFRNTPQWFISMEKTGLRKTALEAIAATQWVPPLGRNRIQSMIESRPDWCISRQRQWGVPLAVFTHKVTGELLRDQAVIDRIADAVAKEGGDAWLTSPPERFLGNSYKAEDWNQVTDIIEVWFDSGSTHAFVLEQRPDLKWPADLYLEGSDQHRGWFHTSLLESCGTRGRAPFDAVLTHGFVLDEKGRKMSKSLGNVVAPQAAAGQSGADILRLWVVGSNYAADLSVGPNIIKQMSDLYRRLRNTLRYLLGNLAGFDEAERLEAREMPELERWVLHRLKQMDRIIRDGCTAYDFHGVFNELHNFCAVDLSALYFDIRKDVLYCDAPSSIKRRASRTVLAIVYDCLVKWLAPFICFTAEEAWLARHPEAKSVHLEQFPDLPDSWRDDALAEKWTTVFNLRRVVTGALELDRAAKRIGASLQAHPKLYADKDTLAKIAGVPMEEICIVSNIALVAATPPDGAYVLADVAGAGAVVELAEGAKCQRCWKVLPDVGRHRHAAVCERCDTAVDQIKAA
ncbi:MAG: isoleucine--tRNA ligase [Rhodospirillaceae bacterium]|nr:isoleucine--tRNA ligase [Rhodospirillaceae bacterium]